MTDWTLPHSVLIVGGSLTGLMHALTFLSLPSPPQVRILERSPAALLHNQGAGLIAGNETQTFLREYVRPGQEIAINNVFRHYLNRQGTIIPESIEHRPRRMMSWDLLYNLLRWRVDGMQSAFVDGMSEDDRPHAVYENGCTVTDVSPVEGGVKVTWKHRDRGEESAMADLVIAADGASSVVRSLLQPDAERTYAGYVAWRGTVRESELSDSAKEVFIGNLTFYHAVGLQCVAYPIPGRNGTLVTGQRLLNWVWYLNYPQGSAELEELMTDVDGRRHTVTLPVNKMQPQLWVKQKEYAADILPPPLAEAIGKTRSPFVQAITDNISRQNSFFDGHLLLVGDALAGFRPHTGASTSQAAHDALELAKLLRGEIGKAEYDKSVLDFASRMQELGVSMGVMSQQGKHQFAA